MVLPVNELKDFNPDLPQEFLDELPVKCPECGVVYMINETLTAVTCGNARCSDKVAMRVKDICTKLNILQFGESRIRNFIETYDVTNPMDIFDLHQVGSIGNDVGEEVSANIIAQIEDIRLNRKWRLWEAVAVQALPGIQTSANAMFSGYDTIDEFYDALDAGGLDWVKSRLGIVGDTVVRALNVYQTLLEYRDDIIEGVNYLDTTWETEIQDVTICVSDSAGAGFKSKQDFYNKCKSEYGDRFHFNFAGSVSRKSTEVLIWGGADGSGGRYTSKVESVERYNTTGAGIPILTGQQFIDFLETGRPWQERYDYSLEINELARQGIDNGAENDVDMSSFGLL